MKTKITSVENHIKSRYVAFKIIKKIIIKKNMLDSALKHEQSFIALEARDRSFVRLIISQFLRRNGQAEKILKMHVKKFPNNYIKIILKIGIIQLLFLDTHDHAVVDTSVNLTKKIGLRNYVSFVNAVLRKIALNKEVLKNVTKINENFSSIFLKKLTKNWGLSNANQILNLFMKNPPLDITIIENINFWKKELKGIILNNSTIRTNFSGDISKMSGYKDGKWFVQDVASSLPCKLFGKIDGKKIFDLCAAPGGKTIQLINLGGKVTAIDISESRLKLLRENLKRLNLNANIICNDVLNFSPDSKADFVLLDAPCSSSGTIRRKPDILINQNLLSLKKLQTIQTNMLIKALKLVKKDGLVIFSTCSIFKEEGEEIIEKICNVKNLAEIDPINPSELGIFSECIRSQGWARVLPNSIFHNKKEYEEGNDGFFIVRLKSNIT